MLYPALVARRLVGTDIVHAIPLTFMAGLGHLGMGFVDFKTLPLLLLGSITSIAVGLRITGIVRLVAAHGAAIVLVNAGVLLLRG
jgi:hypothetical protein